MTIQSIIQDLNDTNTFVNVPPSLTSTLTSLQVGETCTNPGLVNGIYVCNGGSGPTFNYATVYPDPTNGPLAVMQAAITATGAANIPGLQKTLTAISLLDPSDPNYLTNVTNALKTSAPSQNAGVTLANAANAIQTLDAALSPLNQAASDILTKTNYNAWLGAAQNSFQPPGPLDVVSAFVTRFYPASGSLLAADARELFSLAALLPLPATFHGVNVPGVHYVPPSGVHIPFTAVPPTPAPAPAPVAPVTIVTAPAANNTALYVGGAVLAVGVLGAIAYAATRSAVLLNPSFAVRVENELVRDGVPQAQASRMVSQYGSFVRDQERNDNPRAVARALRSA